MKCKHGGILKNNNNNNNKKIKIKNPIVKTCENLVERMIMEHNDEGFEIVSEIKITRNSNERLNNFQ